jgi:uncharacterized protein involved in exopolysaccharide biosynthesis
MTPTYKVEILLAPIIDESAGSAGAALAGQLGGLASLAGLELGSGGGAKDQAVALLQSRTLTREFISEHNLLPVLFANSWDESSTDWKASDPEDVPTMWMGIKKFDRIRSVSESQKTGLVILAIEWSDPIVAASWATELVDQVNNAMRELAIEEAERSVEFLQSRLSETEIVEVRQAIYTLLEGQTKSLMMADIRREYAFKVLDPAIPPDLGDPSSPRKVLMTASGFVLGLMIGILLVLMPVSFRRKPEPAPV